MSDDKDITVVSPYSKLRKPYDWYYKQDSNPLLKSRYVYNISYAEELIEHMAIGGSYTAFAGEIRVPVAVLDRWMNEEPSFVEAVAIGEAAYLAYWENLNRGASAGEIKSNAAAMIFRLKNSFPQHYRDKQEEESNRPATIIIQTGIERGNAPPIEVEYRTIKTDEEDL